MKDTREIPVMPHATSILGPAFAPADALEDIPILYEDEDEEEMGDSNPHTTNLEILHVGVKAHLQDDPRLQAFANMNLYYRKGPEHERTRSLPYISPDVMIVAPFQRLPEELVSYTIGREGPAPLATIEALSQRTAQQRDLDEKVTICARLGVAEYILVDPSGQYLPERLLLKRLQPDGTYRDEKDPDGGVTSVLGFRIVIEADDKVRIVNAATGRRYLRPDEAEEEAQRRQAAEAAQRSAEAATRQAEDARRQAEDAQRQAEDARRQAEDAQRQAEDAQRQAEVAKQAEAERRRAAEEALRAAEAEIAALREQLRKE